MSATSLESTTTRSDQPFRVLCLDGGGMRGIYTASYISHLAHGFSEKRCVGRLDVGAGFNLIVGTSTGAIIGCALAAGIPPERVVRLYREHGSKIFRRSSGGNWFPTC